MSVYLMVDNLHKTYGADDLLSGISFGIDEGEKIGLIAKNGSGKSTLLRLLAGVEEPDSGTVTRRNDLRVGYLPQLPSFGSAITVLDACLQGNGRQAAALRRYEQANAGGNSDDITVAIQEMDAARAWDYESRFTRVLSKLKITDLTQHVDQLSGGQAKRVALARVLLDEPQLLLLDEPTNHLDIEMIEWLENHLRRTPAALLMVTHDRYFLDNVCSRIIEIDLHRAYSYDGNYNYYLEKRAERIEAAAVQAERARNLLRTELEWMRRQPQARAHKAQYRIDAFFDLKERAANVRTDRQLELNVGGAAYIGNKIFTAEHVCHRFGDKVILNDFTYTFARYERLGIVGDNGVGKSTFIKLLLGLLRPDSGHFDVGQTVRFGYYSQEGIAFRDDQRVIDAVRDVAEYVAFDEKTQYSASQLLQMFLFSTRDQQKPIAKLSGGERRRLYLATVLMSRPNFLILDEPTNDLDITTLGVLEDYLAHFKGCVIVVSHDRFFMDRTVDHIWVMRGGGVIRDFPGNYSEYRAWAAAHAGESDDISPSDGKSGAAPKAPRRPMRERPARLTYRQRQELEQTTTQITTLTAEKAALNARFASGEALTDAASLSARYEQISRRLDELELRWLELSELAE